MRLGDRYLRMHRGFIMSVPAHGYDVWAPEWVSERRTRRLRVSTSGSVRTLRGWARGPFYQVVRVGLNLKAGHGRTDRAKDAEILALRHQHAVL